MGNEPTDGVGNDGAEELRRFTPDPKRVFRLGAEYEFAYLTLRRPFQLDGLKLHRLFPFSANTVLQTLAIELYLKCLHTMDHGFHYDQHPPRKLFCRLKGKTQDRIRFIHAERDSRTRWNATTLEIPNSGGQLYQVPTDVHGMLKASNMAWLEWRYSHEFDTDTNKPLVWVAEPLISVLRVTILEREPTWKSLLAFADPTMPPTSPPR